MFLSKILKEDAKSNVLKLQKPIYELKQAQKQWHEKFKQYIHTLASKKSNVDPCLFLKDTPNGRVLILIYVDDFIIDSPKKEVTNYFESKFKKELKITDLWEAKRYLGINSVRNKSQ